MRRRPRRATRTRRRARRATLALTTCVVLAATLLSGCGGSSPKPGPTLAAFLGAWSRGDWATMRARVADPPTNFTALNAGTFAALGVSGATFTAGPPRIVHHHGGGAGAPTQTATATLDEHYSLPHIGTWNPTSTIELVLRGGAWKVAWSPQTIDPQLDAGETIAVTRNWPTRAPILGAGGAPLTRTQTEVDVGIVGSRVTSYAAVRTDLLAAGATAAEVSSAIAQARAHPQELEPVFTISFARFEALKAQTGPDNVYAVRGTEFPTTTQSGAITDQLAEHVVGTVGPISAAQLRTLGSRYTDTSVVGQSGLEESQQTTLAGTPTTEINVDDSGGNPISRLATYRGHAGSAVRTTLDPRVQRAAEAALATSSRPNVAMVALQASTGRVLAIVSDPLTTYDTALEGAYPPGSTFKVITSTALFSHGLSPSSPASCPSTIDVDGESFHNAGAEQPTPTITQAFIESCNTAYIGLAVHHLTPADFPAAASLYGLQGSPHLGLGAFYANVNAPTSQTQLAGDAIGQGNVTFSTLGMATVAAAIDSGALHAPTLVLGASGSASATGTGASGATPLPAAIVDGLRPMMLGVVQSGTAAGTGLPAGTHAKTGTAQYGPQNDLKIDGWLMGYDGDIAFAIVTQNTGGADGGPVDGPIIARFFDALHGSG